MTVKYNVTGAKRKELVQLISNFIMAMFNEDCLCMECKEVEREKPEYRSAVETDNVEIRKENYDFKGIGYPGE